MPSGHALAERPLGMKNTDFVQRDDDGRPVYWRHGGGSGNAVVEHDDAADETYARVTAGPGGGASYIEQTVPLPEDAVQVKFEVVYRYWNIVPGERGYQRGKIQGRYLNSGDETGPWIDCASVAGTQEEWQVGANAKDVVDGADAVFFRIGMYDVKSGCVEVREVRASVITEDDLAAIRSRYRPAKPYGRSVPETRIEKLSRGLNINGWFCQPYNVKGDGHRGGFSAEHFRSFISDDELKRMATVGFRHLRLPIDPEAFVDKDTGALNPELLPELDTVIRRVVDVGLAVDFDPHPKMHHFKRMADNRGRPDQFLRWWKEMAAHLHRTTDPDWVFLETLNEPGGQAYYGQKWSDYQDRLIMAIRASAPEHTIVANAGGYQLVRDLENHVPHSDRNVVYAVHYYEPSQFTHQGAQWMKDWYIPLRSVPWPVDERQRDQISTWIDTDHEYAEKSREAIAGMLSQGLGKRERIEQNFEKISAWSAQHDRRIVINEFGVYTKFAAKTDAMAWTEAVVTEANRRGYGWSLWEYTGDFGFAQPVIPEDRQWDEQRLDALGF